MIIKWKGKIGYGDIVSPICYAINQSEARNEVVHLEFYWKLENEDLHLNSLRAKFIADKINHSNVIVDHKYGNDLGFNHTNYFIKAKDPSQTFHNIYFPNFKVTPKYNVVCSPLYNKKQMKDYGLNKEWKDGLFPDQWEELINRSDTIHVDYRTPIEELFDIMSNCRHFIGYHGSCSWVARLFGVPMTVFSHDKQFTQWAFPWQDLHTDQSKILLSTMRDKRNEYIDNIRWA